MNIFKKACNSVNNSIYKELGFDIVPVKVLDKLYFNGVVLLVALGIMDKDITGDKVADFILCCPDVG